MKRLFKSNILISSIIPLTKKIGMNRLQKTFQFFSILCFLIVDQSELLL